MSMFILCGHASEHSTLDVSFNGIYVTRTLPFGLFQLLLTYCGRLIRDKELLELEFN